MSSASVAIVNQRRWDQHVTGAGVEPLVVPAMGASDGVEPGKPGVVTLAREKIEPYRATLEGLVKAGHVQVPAGL